MNRELFSFSPQESSERALRYLYVLGIGGAPVLDSEGRPVGMISLRDLTRPGVAPTPVSIRMSTPVGTIAAESPLQDAGRLLAETGFHRLVVVDEVGRAVGLVSTLDVIRGLLGMPASHPSTFPHYDSATGLTWTDDTDLSFDRVEVAPEGPGVFVLLRGGPGEKETVVWSEAALNVRRRLVELLASHERLPSPLQPALAQGRLRFRAAAAADSDARVRALRAVAPVGR